ncbi:hypothetical protein BC830DRAFT_839434 [Chytriomyces sp. MP71]|nr:hypothetical protein BC830DRAFT_839434 [Chytriomyces sp. MP71]
MLAAFIPLTEQNVTGYMGVLLPVLYKVLAADEMFVIREVTGAAGLLGRYVDPDLYLGLLLSHVGLNPDASGAFTIGVLRVLGALVSGTPVQKLTPSHRARVAAALADRDVLVVEDVTRMREVAEVVKVLAGKMTEVAGEVGVGEEEGIALFGVLTTLVSVPGSDKVPGWSEMISKAEWAFLDFAKAHNFDSVDKLIPTYFDQFLTNFTMNVKNWTRFSIGELRTLDVFLQKAGPFVGERLEPLIELFAHGVTEEKDFEVRQW